MSEEKITIEGEEEQTNPVNENELKIYEYDLKIQELEIILEELEAKVLADEDMDSPYIEEYEKKKAEYKQLRKERKLLVKEIQSKDESKLNQVSLWVFIYGIIECLLSFPFIASTLWLDVANFLIDKLQGSFSNLYTDSPLYYIIVFLIIFAVPLIINLITWLVFSNCIKTKENKKVYSIFWIIQGLMSLGMIIYMSVILFGAV